MHKFYVNSKFCADEEVPHLTKRNFAQSAKNFCENFLTDVLSNIFISFSWIKKDLPDFLGGLIEQSIGLSHLKSCASYPNLSVCKKWLYIFAARFELF